MQHLSGPVGVHLKEFCILLALVIVPLLDLLPLLMRFYVCCYFWQVMF
jgi:hypothetical protein